MPKKRLFLLLGVILALLVATGVAWRMYRGTLAAEAQIIYSLGDVQPISSVPFYLLDSDPYLLHNQIPAFDDQRKKLLEHDNENYSERMKAIDQINAHENVAILFNKFNEIISEEGIYARIYQLDPKQKDIDLINYYKFISRSLETIAVQSGKTDFKGIVVFADLKPGDYWLTGISTTRNGLALWNTKVKVVFGHNKYVLDQSNAAYAH